MKKIAKRFDVSKLLIIAMAVVISFSMAACPEDNGNEDNEDGNGNNNGNENGNGNGGDDLYYFGNKLELSGQVDLQVWNEIVDDYYGSSYEFSYESFSGDLAIKSIYGGSGQIKGGKLSYSIGVPVGMYTLDLEDDVFDWYDFDNFTFTPSGEVKGVVFRSLQSNSINYGYLYRENSTHSEESNSFSDIYEWVKYVYVDKDITVKGTGRADIEDDTTYEEIPYTWTETFGDIDLKLKAGWNVVYFKEVTAVSYTGTSWENCTSYTGTETYTMSLENPSSLKWIMQDYSNIHFH
jgi:hypothetical protein